MGLRAIAIYSQESESHDIDPEASRQRRWGSPQDSLGLFRRKPSPSSHVIGKQIGESLKVSPLS
jgi:hypothetical protein